MDDCLKSLVELFIENSIEKIDKTKGFFDDVKQKYENENIGYRFNDDHLIVRQLKERIEDIGTYSDTKRQANECLVEYSKIINQLSREKNEIFGQLVKKYFYEEKWTNKTITKKYYDEHLPLIIKGYHFFFSYTNRNARGTNRDFKHVLGKKVDHDRNHLAKLIFERLCKHNIIGFWDEKNIDYGQNIQKVLSENLKKVYCFVQLIEQEVFVHPGNGKKNWCHEEYKEFKNSKFVHENIEETNCERLFFIIQDDRALNIANTSPYLDWVEEIKATKHFKWKNPRKTKWEKIIKTIDKLAFRICEERNNALKRMLD